MRISWQTELVVEKAKPYRGSWMRLAIPHADLGRVTVLGDTSQFLKSIYHSSNICEVFHRVSIVIDFLLDFRWPYLIKSMEFV